MFVRLFVYVCRQSFSIATPTVFLRFSLNLAHVIYVPMRKKTVEQIF